MENPNLQDIPDYEGLYKFDKVLLQVYSIKKNMYLKINIDKGSYYVILYKNGKVKRYSIRKLFYICNPRENENLVAILDYDDYKFDTKLEKVYCSKYDRYLKNSLIKGYYQVNLYKNKIKTTFGIHKLVYMLNYPNEDLTGFEIDHIDNNKLNNKIENLRKATRSDNNSNKKAMINNKLGIKNIYKTKYGYEFNLTKNGIKYYKSFKTIEEAIEHRNRVVLEKCGEFANVG